MITLLKRGNYRLIETKHQTKILTLDGRSYAWVEPTRIGELLVVTHKTHRADCVLSVGEYRIYDVQDEPLLTDLKHLVLEVGHGEWQSYLLLTGLPTDDTKRSRIVPTVINIMERVTENEPAHK